MEHNKPLLLLLSVIILSTSAAAAANITGIYAFGDSIFDAGNNNNLFTICRSDHQPYGNAFPNRTASGRFSDGMLPTDILVSELGIKAALPAYKDSAVSVDDIAGGVSFASSCSGLDDLTSRNVGVLRMSRQFEYFEEAFEKMRKKMAVAGAVEVVENALFLISGGSNDMIDNYYPLPVRRVVYTVPQYHDLLIRNLESFVKRLYRKGARKMAVLGMPPLGCLPIDVTVSKGLVQGKRECVVEHNKDARSYNLKLQALIKRLNIQMPHSKIAYADIYAPLMEMITNPKKFGLEHTLEGCCGSGVMELGPLCGKLVPTCSDPSKYLFWDAAHPTQAAYKILTEKFQDTLFSTMMS